MCLYVCVAQVGYPPGPLFKACHVCPAHGAVHLDDFLSCRGLQTQCGVNFFILDSRRVLAPAPNVPGSDVKTHLKSSICVQAIKKKGGSELML